MEKDNVNSTATMRCSTTSEESKSGNKDVSGEIQRDNRALFLQEDDEFEDFKADGMFLELMFIFFNLCF